MILQVAQFLKKINRIRRFVPWAKKGWCTLIFCTYQFFGSENEKKRPTEVYIDLAFVHATTLLIINGFCLTAWKFFERPASFTTGCIFFFSFDLFFARMLILYLIHWKQQNTPLLFYTILTYSLAYNFFNMQHPFFDRGLMGFWAPKIQKSQILGLDFAIWGLGF